VEGRASCTHEEFFKIRPISFNASGFAAFSAATHEQYIDTERVAAPAGMPAAENKSFTQDMNRHPPDSDGFEAIIVLLKGFGNRNSLSPQAGGDQAGG
jgi:hypothetical protein